LIGQAKILLYKICTKLLKPQNEDRSTNQSYHKRITITAKWFDIRVHDSWRGHSPNCTKQWRVIQGNRTESCRLYNLVDHLNITHYQSKVRTDTFSDEHIFVHKYKLNLFTKLTFFLTALREKQSFLPNSVNTKKKARTF